MKKIIIFFTVLFATLSVIAAEGYSSRFISSFQSCTPYTETTSIKDLGGQQASLTKIIQGVKEHNCVYKQVILRKEAREVTTCSFSKLMSEQIVEAMNEETGEKFNVELNMDGNTVMLYGLTKSQIIWTQYLNTNDICKREIIPRG